MGTRREELLTVTFTLHNGDEIELQDTAVGQPAWARSAYEDFLAKEVDVILMRRDGEPDVYVPFHSILKAEVERDQGTQTYTDPMCVSP